MVIREATRIPDTYPLVCCHSPPLRRKEQMRLEGDFNATNKIVYGVRMLQNARIYNMMPEEIFSKKNRMADDGTLCKSLFFDIARQA